MVFLYFLKLSHRSGSFQFGLNLITTSKQKLLQYSFMITPLAASLLSIYSDKWFSRRESFQWYCADSFRIYIILIFGQYNSTLVPLTLQNESLHSIKFKEIPWTLKYRILCSRIGVAMRPPYEWACRITKGQ